MKTVTMTSIPLILSLETATPGGSVFLGRGTLELATRIGDPQVSHSNSLLRDISNCLEEAGVSLQDVDLFACASGPGSFTGLRIGIATLKALAVTLRRPCGGIPTLEAVAYAAGSSRATVALLPAGRGEVFAQMFSVSESGIVTEMDSAAHLSPQKVVNKYGTIRDLAWAGSGAHLQRNLLEDCANQQGIVFAEHQSGAQPTNNQRGWILAPLESKLAAHVAALALQKFESGDMQLPQTLSAFYVRPSDAELKGQCR
ncbi:MAG: tRNA (adenosine(37)-N6)-threonylcarbamoyltransferase complex dimerization subunit type 1 TsaB [Acidobacteriota bacterium]|nr:tRNA (adenosine(37)-N6)-threonylcarbamoyltransferase complex dimerization subunit type 1 TsaB [Acidobacteriota bacterium]